jgi:hypothetical protein
MNWYWYILHKMNTEHNTRSSLIMYKVIHHKSAKLGDFIHNVILNKQVLLPGDQF